MPGSEITLGYIPKRDGSDYDPKYVGPSWDQLLNAVKGMDRIELIYTGKLYQGSDKISGLPVLTNKLSLQRTALQFWSPGEGRLTDLTRDPQNTPMFAQFAHGLDQTPVHITGIVIRSL